MPTLTISLSELQWYLIQQHAAALGLSPEDYVQRQIEAALLGQEQSFSQVAAYVLQKNEQLYRRLA